MKHTTYLIRAFLTVVLIGAMSACVAERQELNNSFGANGKLSVKGTVSEATLVTRAASVVDLKEKQLNTLDVFVEHVSNEDQGKFIKQYHLVASAEKPITEELNLLAEHWRQEGLAIDEKYNIYVAVNNTQTKDEKDLTEFNVEVLKSLVADEKTDGIAVIQADGTIGWKGNSTSGNIYKLYDANPGDARALTSEKAFMMDGVIKNWTPDPAKTDQVFDVTLNRAASKFVLNVKFDADFLQVLSNEGVSITGSPAWKFYNFAFGAPVFAPETQGAGVEVHNSGFNIFHNESCADGKSFTITTYSYPNKWAEADYATAAPSLVISIGFTEGTGTNAVTNYHYYRIPLVKSTVTEIGRNNIYVVNATIATRGSATQEDADITEDIQYAVLPWNDQTNSDVIENNVSSVQHYYFNVNPKVYTLRGDGDQSIVLNYSKATGTKVNWKLFTYNAAGDQTGVVANNANNAVRAWFYDAGGQFTTTYNDNSGTDWSKMGVDIVQSTEGTSGSKGKITVTSTALNNKGIKYIRLRVYLDETETFDGDNETMYEDIIIRHFPTDNIQSIEGSWSSYHDADASTSTTEYTTANLAEAQALAEQYGISYSSEEKTDTELINYSTWYANQGISGYNRTVEPILRNVFTNNVQQYQREGANSEANARLSNSYYYWGENPQSSNQYQSDYDYRTGMPGNRTYWRYSSYYRATYTHTYTYTEYTLNLPIPSTGDWVNWEDRESHSSARRYQYSYLGQNQNLNRFIAKVAINGNIRYIVENGTGYYGNNPPFTTGYSNTNTGLTNNHMYVIQISSTSEKYILGRPYVDSSTHQSDDDVVSPAFMIASQLGAVTPFSGRSTDQGNATDAANHCSRYMEVSNDGTYYTGWRLPTAAEIKVITEYQYGTIGSVTVPSQYRVLTPVLTGYYYWDLAGGAQRAWQATPEEPTYSSSTDKSYLRCVRDLSAEEVDRLNGFDKIQEKYR